VIESSESGRGVNKNHRVTKKQRSNMAAEFDKSKVYQEQEEVFVRTMDPGQHTVLTIEV